MERLALQPELDSKVVYRRYASLFFVTGISSGDNELVTLEIIHRYVEVLDRYFGNVSCFQPLKAGTQCNTRCRSASLICEWPRTLIRGWVNAYGTQGSSTFRRHSRFVIYMDREREKKTN